TERIRELNDAFRGTFAGGTVMMTSGVDELPDCVKAEALRQVATFSDFTPDNDPHGEHDFGSFTLVGRKFFWKIDYYDRYAIRRSGGPEEDHARPHDHARERILNGTALLCGPPRDLPAPPRLRLRVLCRTFHLKPSHRHSTSKEENHVVDHSRWRKRDQLR